MDLKLKPVVNAVLFLALLVSVVSMNREEHPEGLSLGLWRGEVRTVTGKGAMLSTCLGDFWVSSSSICCTALSRDSLLVLGRSNHGFITPLSIRLKPWESPVRNIRSAFRSLLAERVADPRARGLAGGLLMGLRGMIRGETANCFRNSGTSHLLALSGLHTAAAAAVIMLLCSFLFGKRPVSMVITASGILAFVAVSGARASTVRAGIMSICALLWMSRRGGTADTLSFWWLALAVSLIIMPETLTDRGAWMSYGAVLSLILFGKNFRGRAGFILSPLFAGITVTTALAPLTVSMYGGLAWLGPAATVFSLPVMVSVMLLGAAAAAGIPASAQILTVVSDFWHEILVLFRHEPIAIPWSLMWILWASALVGLRVISRWNGFHRRFR